VGGHHGAVLVRGRSRHRRGHRALSGTVVRLPPTIGTSDLGEFECAHVPPGRGRSTGMGRDVAPVITARVLLAHGVRDDVVSAYVASMWALNDVDVRAAVAAAHVLLRRVQTADRSPLSDR